jgi:Protein of unknown function (DUF1488)
MQMFRHDMIQISDDGLVIRVAVDGRQVAACLPGQILQRLFGAAASDGRSWLSAYRRHAARINHAAIVKGRRQNVPALTLHDEDFERA